MKNKSKRNETHKCLQKDEDVSLVSSTITTNAISLKTVHKCAQYLPKEFEKPEATV